MNIKRDIFRLLMLCFLWSCAQIQTEQYELYIKGSESMQEVFKALSNDFHKLQDSIHIVIEGGGSRTGLMAINNEEVDIGMSSYQFDLNSELGEEHGITERVVAYDGIVLITNEKNPVRELTDDQIADIYSGRVADWSELGGRPGKILPIRRDENSGTQRFFTNYFGINQFSEQAMIARENDEIFKTVVTMESGIGFVGFSYFKVGVNDLLLSNQTEGSVGGFFSPTVENLTKGYYPLKRALSIYYKNDENEARQAFLDYLHSDRAQHIISESGLAPLSMSFELDYAMDY